MVPTLEAVSQRRPAVAPDLPGFGHSRSPRSVLGITSLADALAGWLDRQGLRRPVVLANSLGCQVAVELARRRPVSGLVLVGPTVDAAARTWHQQVIRLLQDGAHEPPRLLAVLARDYLAAGPRRVLGTFRHALAHRPEIGVSQLDAPVVVVRGEHDPIASRRWCLDLAHAARDGTYHEVAGAGHVVNWTHPDVLARIVEDIVRDHHR